MNVTSFKESLRKHRTVVATALLCSVLLASAAYAVGYLWSTPVSANISTSSPYLKVYYDPSCTQEVTTLDFGNLVPGAKVRFNLYITNTDTKMIFSEVTWSSTLGTVTDKITDAWNPRMDYPYPYNPWPVTIGPGQIVYTYYEITVASNCPLASYSWTLYLHGSG